jgi:methyltransferase-like protein 6
MAHSKDESKKDSVEGSHLSDGNEGDANDAHDRSSEKTANASEAPQPSRKRTRKGESFLNLDEVVLHATDFKFEDIAGEVKLKIDQAIASCPVLVVSHDGVKQKTFEAEVIGNGSVPAASASSSGATPLPAAGVESWEGHYRRNRGQFFPVKNYICSAFPLIVELLKPRNELRADSDVQSSPEANVRTSAAAVPAEPEEERGPSPLIVECGCGSGSVVLPLMRYFPVGSARYICFDISPTAVEVLQQHPVAKEFCSKGGSLTTFAHDVSFDGPIPSTVPPKSASIVLLIFVLCAIPVSKMVLALKKLHACLKPDTGRLLFRDYGIYDHNHARYATNGNPITPDGSFIKGDGTQQYFFELGWARDLFAQAGFDCVSLDYHCNRVVNRANGKTMNKIFVNGVFAPTRKGNQD